MSKRTFYDYIACFLRPHDVLLFPGYRGANVSLKIQFSCDLFRIVATHQKIVLNLTYVHVTISQSYSQIVIR